MLLYQSQGRNFKLSGENLRLQFPCPVEIQIRFAPEGEFGGVEGPIGFALRPPKGNNVPDPFNLIYYNANTGSYHNVPKIAMDKLEIEFTHPALSKPMLELKGNVLTWRGPLENLDEAQMTIVSLTNALPAALNLFFPDPVIVTNVRGTFGAVAFNWELAESQFNTAICECEQLQRDFVESIEIIKLFNGIANRRLLTALRYFYTADRLIAAGNSPYEFLGEHVLNLCKALEVMFVQAGNAESSEEGDTTRKQIRAGLQQFGFAKPEIESEFIPLLILRGHFDVAHAKMVLLEPEQLKIVYRFLVDRRPKFRELFKRVIQGIKDGSPLLPDYGDLEPNEGEQRGFDRLVESMAKSESVSRLPK